MGFILGVEVCVIFIDVVVYGVFIYVCVFVFGGFWSSYFRGIFFMFVRYLLGLSNLFNCLGFDSFMLKSYLFFYGFVLIWLVLIDGFIVIIFLVIGEIIF